MQNKNVLSGPSFLRRAISLSFCAGLSLGLLSSGCDKGDDKDSDEDKKEVESEGKEDSDGKEDTDGKKDTEGDDDNKKDDDKKDDTTGDNKPADKDQLTEDQKSRVLKLCKETCEKKEVLECKENGLGEKVEECVEDCSGEVGSFFAASTDEVCLDSLEGSFSCMYELKCDEFPDMFPQLLKLLDKESKFEGGCADEFDKSAEHCAEDLKKALGDLPIDELPIDPIDPNKPAPEAIDIVVNETKWTTAEATITKQSDGGYKIVISQKTGLACGEDENKLDSAISISLEDAQSDKGMVYFHYDKKIAKMDDASVSLVPTKSDKQTVQIEATHSSGNHSVVGMITAKVCEEDK